ncbi:AtpZ/AtpI family protein [Pleomorphovibrio marinus]|uniref:AtpZ/AtpI family protein n=1 Tax=Pleomorphovibrio marinus TaxID=2164132 RepID=UPI000E0ABB95|nr:AtpZ/AtpI family protein [Pleomorphovibrio marinus]
MGKRKSPPEPTPSFIKYTGLAFQMLTIIALGTWLGHLIDQKAEFKFPVGLLAGCLLSTLLAFYQLFKSLPKD